MADGKSYTIHKGKKSQSKTSKAALKRMRESMVAMAYRMDSVGEVDGVSFLNDSRSVDLLSTRDSFKCLAGPAVWLTTTTPHERDFALIEKYISKKIKAIVVYGAEAIDMRSQLAKLVNTFLTVADLKEAVNASFKLAEANDLVIYSPSCVAEDGYLNFVDRGQAFDKYVKELKKS
jgi:UDP-N-acetylmuramoylalanine--D-glutamate ligase